MILFTEILHLSVSHRSHSLNFLHILHCYAENRVAEKGKSKASDGEIVPKCFFEAVSFIDSPKSENPHL